MLAQYHKDARNREDLKLTPIHASMILQNASPVGKNSKMFSCSSYLSVRRLPIERWR